MKDVKITVMRICEHKDLIELYKNPIEHACDMKVGLSFVSKNAEKPDGMCDPAWSVMRKYVSELACGGGNFFEISSSIPSMGKACPAPSGLRSILPHSLSRYLLKPRKRLSDRPHFCNLGDDGIGDCSTLSTSSADGENGAIFARPPTFTLS